MEVERFGWGWQKKNKGRKRYRAEVTMEVRRDIIVMTHDFDSAKKANGWAKSWATKLNDKDALKKSSLG
jgi:hypothetical protein